MSNDFSGLKVFAVCNHPGGVNAIVPVLVELCRRGAECQVIASDFGVRRCLKEGIPAKVVNSYLTYEAAKKELCQYNSDYIVLGTSEPADSHLGRLEVLFSLVARDEKIPSLAVLDHWCGYQSRFSSSDERLLDVLPNTICVMNEQARRDMLVKNFPKECLVVTGNPHWDALKIRRKKIVATDRTALRYSFGLKASQRLMLFISEPLAQDKGDNRGYTQIEVLKQIVQFLYNDPQLLCWIKLHPRENPITFPDSLDDSIKRRITVLSDEEFMDRRAHSADIIVGMTSMLLFEYFLLGLPTISYQPAVLKREIIKFGYGLRVVYSLEKLRKICLTSAFSLENRPVSFNATEKVMNVIKKTLNKELVKDNA